MAVDGKRQFELLERIGFVRMSGTAEERKAAEMIMEEIRKIGLDPVLEPFEVTTYEPVRAKLEVTEPVQKEYEVRGYVYQDPICVENQEYDFYFMEQADPVSLAKAKGKFVLLNERPRTEAEYARLADSGIAGFISMSGRVIDKKEETDLEQGKLRKIYRTEQILPAVNMRMADALDLLKLHPEKIRVTSISREKKVTSHNVVVTLPGSEYPRETIVVGAHYDSVEFSYGVWDNGAGVVTIMELLRYMAENPPKRTMKFIFFGSEEVGLRGSMAYLRMHPEEVEKTVFMFNLDVGGNILGNNIALISAEDDLGSYVKYLAKEVGYSTCVQKGIMSSDSAIFNDYGIPTLALGRKGPAGAGFMHTRYDSISLISPEALQVLTEFLIIVAERMVNSAVFPVSKVIPEDLEKEIMEKFGKGQSETEKRRNK